MRLDVFMQELSYEEITQQQAYDIPRLLGTWLLYFVLKQLRSMRQFIFHLSKIIYTYRL